LGPTIGADSLGEMDSKLVLRKIFGPKRDEVEEKNGVEKTAYLSPNIVRVIT
jgi:hypothetical protein